MKNSTSPRRPLSRGRKLLLVSLPALSLTLLVLEGILRVAGYAPYYLDAQLFVPSADPRIVYQLRPSFDGLYAGVPVSINANGFRGPATSLDAGAEGTRIAIVGDSVAFGQAVREGETLADQLRTRWIAVANTPVHVLNLGVPGYNTTQEYWTFKNQALPFEPRVVIVLYVINDPDEPVFKVESGAVIPPDVRTGWFGELMAGARKHSYIYNYAWLNWQKFKYKEPVVQAHASTLAKKFHDDSPRWQNSKRHLSRLISLARSRSCRVIVVPFPPMHGVHDEPYPFAKYVRAVAEASRIGGAETLDVVPLLRGRDIPLIASSSDSHPSAEVFRVLADHLVKMLR